jgi:hypothetical protein
MDKQIINYDKCHKCDGQGVFLGSDHDGEHWQYDFECEDCQATWDVTLEMLPFDRNNDTDEK